ncbi:hypothetical protein GGR50DRAFT_599922 [Xylaria sp. CBS 124048]|nr:hypothetical protein GGR50DRAFT_599922 [Xylaria sp. CBS 124048]
MSGMTSTGRGGAGNIAEANKALPLTAADLETPVLKTAVITTGRGGSGNMAPNIDPAETRARQDVGPVERGPSTGAMHVGRGGAANVAKPEITKAGAGKEGETTIAAEGEPRASPSTSNTTSANKPDGDNKDKEHSLAKKAKEFFKRV